MPSFREGERTYTFDAENVADGDLQTSWQTPGLGIGERLTLQFPKPVRPVNLQLANGFQWRDNPDFGDLFTANGRVTRLALTGVNQRTGSVIVREMAVQDAPGWQRIPFPWQWEVTELSLTVLEATPGDRWPDLSISGFRILRTSPPWSLFTPGGVD